MLKGTIQADFEEFHRLHPEVYQMFGQFAQDLRGAGKRRLGAKLIIERIRWEKVIAGRSDDFKINNNYTSRYVRRFVQEYPEFQSMFQLRELKSA